MLDAGAQQWIEIPPTAAVREQAYRMLRVHPLRAADALQLAAALVASEFEPRALPFVTLDSRLAEAAAREGFELLA
jgi:predicted nucleic acid-binding protein